QVDAVEGGFRDAEHAGDESGNAGLFGFQVAGLEDHCQQRTGLAEHGGKGAGHNEVIAQSSQVDIAQRNDRPVEAEDHQNLPETADDCTAQGGANYGNGKHGLEDDGQDGADDAGDRTDDQIGQSGHNQQHTDGSDKSLDHIGQVVVEPLLKLCGKEAAQHNGNDRRCIA